MSRVWWGVVICAQVVGEKGCTDPVGEVGSGWEHGSQRAGRVEVAEGVFTGSGGWSR
jgi:hypothetical protein